MRFKLFLATIALAGISVGCVSPVDRIVQRNTKAMGGKAFESVETMRVAGELTVPSMGFKGTFKLLYKAPGRFVVATTMPGLGEVKQGYDGRNVWSVDPIWGNRKITGKEAALVKLTSQPDLATNWREYFLKAEILPDERVSGRLCSVVKFTPEVANPIIFFFDKKTGLAAKHYTVMEAALGTLKVSTLIQDYRDIDGVMTPFRLAQESGDMEYVINIKSVEYNAPIDTIIFAQPPVKKPQR